MVNIFDRPVRYRFERPNPAWLIVQQLFWPYSLFFLPILLYIAWDLESLHLAMLVLLPPSLGVIARLLNFPQHIVSVVDRAADLFSCSSWWSSRLRGRCSLDQFWAMGRQSGWSLETQSGEELPRIVEKGQFVLWTRSGRAWILCDDWRSAARKLSAEEARWPRVDAPMGKVVVGFDAQGQPRLKAWRYGQQVLWALLALVPLATFFIAACLG